VGEQALT
jgi:hypothetical protein